MLDRAVAADDAASAAPRKSADEKRALAYLEASGATAISIIENVTGCSFQVGSKISARAAVVYWLRDDEATAVMRKARRIAGKSPDLTKATSSLTKAANDQRVKLTEHATAMMRAGVAAAKLDQYMASLRGTGVLVEFNRAFKRRRMAATARGEGFMPYSTAMLRFKRALIPILSASGATVAPQSLFSQIFDPK